MTMSQINRIIAALGLIVATGGCTLSAALAAVSPDCSSVGIHSGTDYVNPQNDYVKVLAKNTYKVRTGHMQLPPASALKPLPVDDTAHDVIANAFDLAPILLQSRLCERLGNGTRITLLVDEDNQGQGELGWSRWDPSQHGERFIALNRSFFVNATPVLQVNENNILSALLSVAPDGTPLNNGDQIHTSISVLPAAANTPAMSVLSLIAHEMGHILYSDTAVSNGDREPVFGPGFCGPHLRFHDNSWQNPNRGYGDGKYHDFGEEDQSNVVAAGLPSIADVLTNLEQNQLSTAAAKMLTIYGGSGPKNWANLFATVAKDEDFVETYRLMVLIRAQPTGFGAPVTSMKMSIGNPPTPPTPTNTVDMIANYNSNDLLGYKSKCITDSGLL
jgi:hypothetical protein